MPVYKANGKKDGLQKYNVRVNYISDSGHAKQLTRTAYGLEAAKDLERKLIADIKDKGENPTKRMTVQQLFDEYTVAKQYEIRESTAGKNKSVYDLHIKPTMSNVRLDKLNIALLQKWKLYVEQKGLAIKTKKDSYGIFRAILNYAVKMAYIPKNLLLNVGNFKESSSIKSEMSIYTADEFKTFISVAKRQATERQMKSRELSEWDFYVFFNIAFYCGLRKGEIHALKWSDISGSILSVKRSISQKMHGEDRETSPKNQSSIRTLQMPLPSIRVLNEHRTRQEALPNFSENYRICGGERCLRDSSVDNKNRLYAKLSGLKHIRIHDYRHSHVSVLANEGINIQEIAHRLGHARVEETWNTYSHLYPREEERAVDILNGIA